MTSQKQLEANRRNARMSTGPRTPEGKAIASLNAKRDGFTGQVTTLSDDDRPFFEQFKSEMIAGLQPKTNIELSLANAIAWDTWRLNRLRAIEMNLYAIGAGNSAVEAEGDPRFQTAMSDAATFAGESRKFALMSIYEQRLNRGLHKNLETLLKLQAERKSHECREKAEEVILARYSDLKGLTYRAPQKPSANGSVFSNEEIFAAANRLTALKVAENELWMTPVKVQFAGASSSGSSKVTEWPGSDAA